jgi:hypothetical protein
MNTITQSAEYTAKPDLRSVWKQAARQFLFSGRGPVRGVQIEAVTQRSLLLFGFSKCAA